MCYSFCNFVPSVLLMRRARRISCTTSDHLQIQVSLSSAPTVRNDWFTPLQSQVRAQRKKKTLPSGEQGHCTLRPQAATMASVHQGTWEGGSHSFKPTLWLVQHDPSTEQNVNATVPPAMPSTKLTHEDLLLTNQPSQNRSDIMSLRSSQGSGKHADYYSITIASTRASRISEVPHITDTFWRCAPQNYRSMMLLICQHHFFPHLWFISNHPETFTYTTRNQSNFL